MNVGKLGLDSDDSIACSKTYLEVDYDNGEIGVDTDKNSASTHSNVIDLAIIIVRNGSIYTNAFQYFNSDIVKLAMIGKETSKLYKVNLQTFNNLCEKLKQFNLVLISGGCEQLSNGRTLIDMLIDSYDVYSNIVFIDEGEVSLTHNSLFGTCSSTNEKSDATIYSDVALSDMIHTYNSDIESARLNTALLISLAQAYRKLYVSSTDKLELENSLNKRYNSILSKMQDISSKNTNFTVKKPGALRNISNFVGYNKCTQLKRLVLATKGSFDSDEYDRLCIKLYNSTYKMLSYGLSYGVKMRKYNANGTELKLPFAFAIYNDINDKLFIDNNNYVISFEFMGLMCGGVNRLCKDNSLDISSLSTQEQDYNSTTKKLRKMIDVVDINYIDTDSYLRELTLIITDLEKRGYYIYRFDRHQLSLIVSNQVDKDIALDNINSIIKNSFIQKAILKTYIIKDNIRRIKD